MQAETVNKINLKISIWNKTLSNTGKPCTAQGFCVLRIKKDNAGYNISSVCCYNKIMEILVYYEKT